MKGRIARLWERLTGFWALRTLAVGALASGADLTVLITLVQFAHFDPVPAAVCGVATGATINFFVNKRFSFRDEGDTRREAVRFALSTGAATGVHAGVVYLLADRWHVSYVLAKLCADVLVFFFGNLAVLRLVVFPPPRRPA